MNSSSTTCSSSDSDNNSDNDSSNQNNCTHYNTNCKFISPCCKKPYSCRHCHNENESHEIDRFAINELICNKCNTIQSISQQCKNCSITFSSYFCGKCNFMDSPTTKNYYHCDDCGICRVGNKNDYFHCYSCKCCLGIKLKDNHKCKDNLLQQDCCICLENFFYSTRTSIKIPCGHFLHIDCLSLHMKNNKINCPLCRKIIFEGERLSLYINTIDTLIQNNPIDDSLSHIVNIKCYDCHLQSEVKYHYFGIKCSHCGGYNTTIE